MSSEKMKTQLEEIRKQKQRRYILMKKIASWLEFDPVKRARYIIWNFIKKVRKLTNPVNEISKDVPGRYRFRFYGYHNPILKFILESHNETIKRIVDNQDLDSDTKTAMATEASVELEKSISNSPESDKLPLIMDIRKTQNYKKGIIVTIPDLTLDVFVTIDTMNKIRAKRIRENVHSRQ